LGRILLADDEETFLHSTADLLRKEGYKCDCVLDGGTAAQMLQVSDYDLLIADIKMPGNPELELIRDLPHIAEGLPVILVTGYPSLRSAIESIQLPVVAYLVKPIDFNQLLAQVWASIEKFRIYRAVRNTRQRLQDWVKDLVGIEKAMKNSNRDTSSIKADTFRELTFRNIIGTLSDLNHLMDTLPGQVLGQEVCHLFDCPRLTELTDTLAETIVVLEKTRDAFKSPKLEKLRQKLERILQDRGNKKLTKAKI
jgi:DNA-binding response OmpR family regulator